MFILSDLKVINTKDKRIVIAELLTILKFNKVLPEFFKENKNSFKLQPCLTTF